MDRQYLKSKLHMTKMMMNIFNFNSAKIFLEIMETQINEASVEGNLFASSSNPLLNMCLLYEILQTITKKFYSLNNQCRVLMGITM